MSAKKINIEIFTVPQAACDKTKANWTQTVQMVSEQLKRKFGDPVNAKHIEFMSANWFEHQQAQKLIEKGEVNFPFVLVEGNIACADKKINISKINKLIESKTK